MAVVASQVAKKARKKNLLDVFHRQHYATIPMDEPEGLMSDNDSQTEGILKQTGDSDSDDEKFIEKGLTDRRRSFIMGQPINNRKVIPLFTKARNKLRGALLVTKMLKDINLFGTGSNLFDVHGAYKKNIDQVMNNKRRHNEEKKEAPQEIPWHIINPMSKFKQIWNIVILILLLYTFTLMPYIIAFIDVTFDSSWFVLDTIVDWLFFWDIIINLNWAVVEGDEDEENEEIKQLITDRKGIFLRYLKGAFIIDVMAIFPFYIFSSGGSAGRSNVFVRFLRMARLSRIFRISKIIGILKFFGGSESMEKFQNFLKMYQGITRLIGAVFIVLLLAHFTACMWYFSAKLDNFNPDTWIMRYKYMDEEEGDIYLIWLYFAITSLTTVGYGDISAFTTAEMIIAMLWMMFGVGVYSFIVGTLSSVLSSMDAKTEMVETKLELYKYFSKDMQLTEKVQKEITKEIRKTSEKVTLDDNQRQNLLMQLPKKLRYDIAMNIYNKAAQNIRFFQGLDQAFIAHVVPLMNHKFLKNKHFVYKKNDYADEMYFIISGRILFVYGQENFIFKQMPEGSYFGEIELIDQKPRDFSVLTEGHCEFFVFARSLFNYAYNAYPKVAQKMKKIAQERKRKNFEAKQEVIDLLEAVEVKKEVNLKDLGGTALIKKLATKKLMAENLPSNFDLKVPEVAEPPPAPVVEQVASSDQYTELRSEVNALKSATLMLSMQADRLMKHLVDQKNSKFKLPPLNPKPNRVNL